jgi:hypothetical protein
MIVARAKSTRMQESLKDRLLNLLNNLDLSEVSQETKREIKTAVKTLSKHPAKFDFSEENQRKAEEFIEYLFTRFPEIRNKNEAKLPVDLTPPRQSPKNQPSRN